MVEGEYIRTKQGYIAKVISQGVYIELDKPVDFKQTSGTHYAGQILFDEGDIEIKSHSKNIIDLIEVGDVVAVKDAIDNYTDTFINEISNDFGLKAIQLGVGIGHNILISILTHEQYEQNCYKVGED